MGFRFAQFENTATPLSPKDTAPVVTVLQTVSKQAPAALREAKDRFAPVIKRLGEQASQQIKDKTRRFGAVVKKDEKGGGA